MKKYFVYLRNASFAVLLLLASCQEDKAREEAVAQARQPQAGETAGATGTTAAAEQPEATGAGLSLSVPARTAEAGSEVCIPVNVGNFNGIVSMQYTLQWDKNILQYKRVQNFNLPGLNANNFGAHKAEKEGILTHSWYDANVQGISRQEGAALYEICFQVKGAAGQKTDIRFTDVPTVREISNSAGQLIPLSGTAGSVIVK